MREEEPAAGRIWKIVAGHSLERGRGHLKRAEGSKERSARIQGTEEWGGVQPSGTVGAVVNGTTKVTSMFELGAVRKGSTWILSVSG